jgi:hypothetical protein
VAFLKAKGDTEDFDDHDTDPLSDAVMTRAGGLLGGHAHFLHWGVVQISLANFVVIVLMVIVFVLALVLPFPHREVEARTVEDPDGHH